MWMPPIHSSFTELYYTGRLQIFQIAFLRILSSADETTTMNIGRKVGKCLKHFSTLCMCNPFMFYKWNIFKLWNSVCWSYEKKRKKETKLRKQFSWETMFSSDRVLLLSLFGKLRTKDFRCSSLSGMLLLWLQVPETNYKLTCM